MQCEEIEELEKYYNSKELHAKVRQLWENKTYSYNNGCILNRGGNFIFEEEDIANRWKEYSTEVQDDIRAKMPRFAMTTGNSILLQEVQQAIISVKNGKATGSDEISNKM